MPPHRFSKVVQLGLGLALFASLSFGTSSTYAADANVDALKAGLQKMQNETKKLTYAQKTWEKKGKDEAWYKADCFWMGQSTIRMDIVDGKGKGGVAIYKGGKVHAFLSGILSFAKLTYEPMDSTVVGIRGAGMPTTGFMDDVKNILSHWDDGKVKFDGDKAIIEYTGPDKLPWKMWAKSDGSAVIKTETYENGAMVMSSEYSRINFAPTFDPKKIFDP